MESLLLRLCVYVLQQLDAVRVWVAQQAMAVGDTAAAMTALTEALSNASATRQQQQQRTQVSSLHAH
jgi:hypothetical protein